MAKKSKILRKEASPMERHEALGPDSDDLSDLERPNLSDDGPKESASDSEPKPADIGSDDSVASLGISVSDSEEDAGEGLGLMSDDAAEVSDEDPLIETVEKKPDEEIAFAGDLKQIKQRIDHAVTLLTNWTAAQSDDRFQELIGGRSRKGVLATLHSDCSIYYGWNLDACEYFAQLFKPTELIEWFEANETARPVTARINSLKVKRKNLISSLVTRGVSSEQLPWCRHGIQINESTVGPGATPEYLAGHYMLQAASSMVPVLALNPLAGDTIVDMAAAPGGKTTHIGQLMKNRGTLFANELDPMRLSSLQANLYRLGIRNAVVINLDGSHLPRLMKRNVVDRVLLDAPCTGSGIAAKDEQVKAKRSLEDFKKHAEVQKRLLGAAIALVNPNSQSKDGGIIVYSTCSVAVEENEEVVEYALRNYPVKLVSFEPAEIGSAALTSYRGKIFHPSLNCARRFYPHRDNMDGFFVAKFKKIALTEERVNKRKGEDCLPKSAKRIRLNASRQTKD